MSKELLEKVRKLNSVLAESTTGILAYADLSEMLSSIVESNVYIIDGNGTVLGFYCINEEDSSLLKDMNGADKVPHEDNRNFLEFKNTSINLIGDDLIKIFGHSYIQRDKFHTIIPIFCGGERLGTLLLARYEKQFTEEDVILCECGATVVGVQILRVREISRVRERNLRMGVEMALETLSYSEKDAFEHILSNIEDEDEMIIVASKIAHQHGMTNSVIVNALKKLESAGLLETKSLGMKGTYIKILNPYLREAMEKLK